MRVQRWHELFGVFDERRTICHCTTLPNLDDTPGLERTTPQPGVAPANAKTAHHRATLTLPLHPGRPAAEELTSPDRESNSGPFHYE